MLATNYSNCKYKIPPHRLESRPYHEQHQALSQAYAWIDSSKSSAFTLFFLVSKSVSVYPSDPSVYSFLCASGGFSTVAAVTPG
jgi:hypothetical protein